MSKPITINTEYDGEIKALEDDLCTLDDAALEKEKELDRLYTLREQVLDPTV